MGLPRYLSDHQEGRRLTLLKEPNTLHKEYGTEGAIKARRSGNIIIDPHIDSKGEDTYQLQDLPIQQAQPTQQIHQQEGRALKKKRAQEEQNGLDLQMSEAGQQLGERLGWIFQPSNESFQLKRVDMSGGSKGPATRTVISIRKAARRTGGGSISNVSSQLGESQSNDQTEDGEILFKRND